MPALNETIAAHNRYQDSLVHAFEEHLREITMRAQGRVIARLQKRLAITDGVIDSTAGNLQALRGAGRLFMAEMDKAGYQSLVTAFTGEFQGTLPYLQDTLAFLGDQVGQKWGADLGFTARDFALLGGMQANTVAALTGAIDSVAGAAITRGLFGIGGLRFGSLVELLGDRLQMGVAQARTVADTGMSTFYATANARAYDIIARGLPPQALLYRYSGPVDKLERPFCRHLTDLDKGYTSEQIGKMSNGMLPNVMITRGGWNCRHQWILDTRAVVIEIPQSA